MRKHVATVLALTIAMGGNFVWSLYSDYQKRLAPSTDWFLVQSINVADGSWRDRHLRVIYDRIIKQPFFADWYAEVKRASDSFLVCDGSGSSAYEPKDQLPDTGVTLEWLIGKPCKLAPGQYYIEVTYKIKPVDYPEKVYQVASNLFTIQ